MSTDATGYLLAGFAALTSWLAFRNGFPLLKLGAAVMWLVLWMWLKDNAPAGTEGQPWHYVALLGCIVMILAIPLAQLGRDTERRYGDSRGAFWMSRSWKWGKGGGEAPAPSSPMAAMRDRTLEYQQRMRRALRRDDE